MTHPVPTEGREGHARATQMANSSTRTDDGHAISGFGVTAKQAIYDAHRKARLYGAYRYPA